jgi:hypothetical protein
MRAKGMTDLRDIRVEAWRVNYGLIRLSIILAG